MNKTNEKRYIIIIAILGVFFLGSFALNGYLILNDLIFDNLINESDETEDDTSSSYLIKYNDNIITEHEALEGVVDTYPDVILEILENKILLGISSEEEKTEAKEKAQETIKELESYYGDNLEEAIKTYTSFESIEDYENYIVYDNILEIKINQLYEENKISSNDTSDPEVISETWKILSNDQNIKFNNKTLEERWKKIINYKDEDDEDTSSSYNNDESNTNTENETTESEDTQSSETYSNIINLTYNEYQRNLHHRRNSNYLRILQSLFTKTKHRIKK